MKAMQPMNPPSQLDADAEGHDELVGADCCEEDPGALLVVGQPHRQALEHGVQAQGQHRQEVPVRCKRA